MQFWILMLRNIWHTKTRTRLVYLCLILILILTILGAIVHTQLGQRNLLLKLYVSEPKTGNLFYSSHQKNQQQQEQQEQQEIKQRQLRRRRLRDWHDYEAIDKDAQHSNGLGEHGKPASLTSFEKTSQEASSLKTWGFNAALSKLISCERSLPDVRHKSCQILTYFSKLPKTSIIIVSHNEEISTLRRTLCSIKNRTPAELLEEIILVDDSSNSKDILVKEFRNSFSFEFRKKLKFIRTDEHVGLIRARILGARKAQGQVLVFLDAHVEATHNWLPPLLHPIEENGKTCTTPIIDTIHFENFAYIASKASRGGFNWLFNYVQLPLLPDEEKQLPAPHHNPIMNGGLFAIAADYFWQLGGYDNGLDIWGAEQFELSFKIWMCGGRILEVPCSRLGHLYRSPEFRVQYTNRSDDFISRNYKRVAEVWMDSYREFLCERSPKLNMIDAGNLSEQHALRRHLKCKSFKWFLETIAADLMRIYPPIEPNDFAYGALKSLAAQELCLDSLNQRPRSIVKALQPCSPDLRHPFASQRWHFSFRNELRNSNGQCLEVQSWKKNAPIWLWPCHNQGGNQFWYYDRSTQLLVQGAITNADADANGRRCLEADVRRRQVFVNDCDFSKPEMKWIFGYLNHTAMDAYSNVFKL